jgi:hypothetical protein
MIHSLELVEMAQALLRDIRFGADSQMAITIVAGIRFDVTATENPLIGIFGLPVVSLSIRDDESALLLSWWSDINETIDICSQAQDFLSRVFSQPWPLCPGHGGSVVQLVAQRADDGQVEWVCPRGDFVASIGRLRDVLA